MIGHGFHRLPNFKVADYIFSHRKSKSPDPPILHLHHRRLPPPLSTHHTPHLVKYHCTPTMPPQLCRYKYHINRILVAAFGGVFGTATCDHPHHATIVSTTTIHQHYHQHIRQHNHTKITAYQTIPKFAAATTTS